MVPGIFVAVGGVFRTQGQQLYYLNYCCSGCNTNINGGIIPVQPCENHTRKKSRATMGGFIFGGSLSRRCRVYGNAWHLAYQSHCVIYESAVRCAFCTSKAIFLRVLLLFGSTGNDIHRRKTDINHCAMRSWAFMPPQHEVFYTREMRWNMKSILYY